MPHNWRRLVLRLTAVVLFSQLVFSWQDPSQDANQKSVYKVAGTVINSVTGRPIPRVLVTLNGPIERAMLTGTEGEFFFDKLPAGNVELRVRKPGFFRLGKIGDDSPPIPVRVGPETENVTVKLDPEAVITGTITGKNEEPVDQALVDVLQWQVIEGRRRLNSINKTVQSDEDGNFRIAGLAPGRYYLSLKFQPFLHVMLGVPAGSANETYPALIYFPGSEDAAGATPLDLTAGQHLDVSFTLKTVPSFRVAGVITNGGNGKQLNSPMLADEFGQVLFQADRFDAQHGTFEFRTVPAGAYWLQYGAVDENGQYSGSRRKLTIQGNLLDLRLTVPRAIDIPVVMHTEFGRPEDLRGQCAQFAPGGAMEPSDCSNFPAAHIQLSSIDFRNEGYFSEAGPLKAGMFIRRVIPGSYIAHVLPIFGGYVYSVRCGELDLLREPLVVPESGPVPPIEVVLRDDSATLTIQLNTKKPMQQSFVLVFGTGVSTGPQIKTFLQGTELQAGPLPPGAYKIFAFDTPEEIDYADPDTLSKYASKAASITVTANEHASVLVDLIHTGE